MLLEMATPDAIARLPHTALAGGARGIWDAYFKEQQHSSLAAFMSHVLPSNDSHLDKRCQDGLLIQVSRENLDAFAFFGMLAGSRNRWLVFHL